MFDLFDLDAGVTRYDGVAAKKCLDTISHEESCDRYTFTSTRPAVNSPSGECAKIITGQSKEGEACGGCEAGLVCAAFEPPTCGTCVAQPAATQRPVEGEPCYSEMTDGPGCVSSAWCSSNGSSTGVCVRRAQPGEACDTTPCTLNSQCQDSVCVLRSDVGATCSTTADCRGGLWCSGVCELLLQNGTACSDRWSCASRNCIDGVCSGPVPEGASCATGFCADNLVCSGPSSDPSLWTCTAWPTAGEPCNPQCAPGLQCLDGTCWSPGLCQ